MSHDPNNLPRSWPFVEAEKIVRRLRGETRKVTFSTGYGPSGRPHIGTFGEVVRTTMVRQALQEMLPGIETELVCVSDDFDALRKIPVGATDPDAYAEWIGRPLLDVPDPLVDGQSYGATNNARLCEFLNAFDFDFTFQSATEAYKTGKFNAVLEKILQNYDAVAGCILPTLGAERRATYSPFMPISKLSGKVLAEAVIEPLPEDGLIRYREEDGSIATTPVTDGNCKLQWKVDWAARQVALAVDYEMAGKDLIDSMKLGAKVARVIGGQSPEGFPYELFLDEEGQKISKTKGNGFTMEEWLELAPQESLQHFMFQKPKVAKKLYFAVIPKAVDQYLQDRQRLPSLEPKKQGEVAAYFIHSDDNNEKFNLTYQVLLNLVTVVQAGAAGDSDDLLWSYIETYEGRDLRQNQMMQKLVKGASAYFKTYVKPNLQFPTLNAAGKAKLQALHQTIASAPDDADADSLQSLFFVEAKKTGDDIRGYFTWLYKSLFGQEQGPRMGSFVKLYGKEAFLKLLDDKTQ